MLWQRVSLVVLLTSSVFADLYLHNPRGSNNRLNERSANRNNANRVFDSQNNNRGGYNVGDRSNQAARNEDQQYPMKYFQSGPYKLYGQTGQGQSLLTVEWTNQHGCGGNEDSDPHKLNCNLVLQYMCQKDDTNLPKHTRIRDGLNTNTQNYRGPGSLTETKSNFENRRSNNIADNKVLHESFEWYDKCNLRERNRGLFTADQKLRTNNGRGYSSAIYTRQNPNGNRRGYECPEERDYYPYWHPTDWVDISVLAQNSTLCSYYRTESQNVMPKHECVEWYANKEGCDQFNTKSQCTTTAAANKGCEWWERANECRGPRKHWSRWNNIDDCEQNNGEWLAFTKVLETHPVYTNEADCRAASRTESVGGMTLWWGSIIEGKESACHTLPDAPTCFEAPWSRVNHLGNGRDAEANNFTWVLPYYANPEDKRCIFRMRYNISTDDYDPYNTNASHNNNPQAGVRSPVTQNPTVTIGSASNIPLRLAINTAQFGRTFQDRSHIFEMPSREVHKDQFGDRSVQADELKKTRIFNLNVRGKRGNIVQVYPSVEYDFMPNNLEMTTDDAVHIQWTGSNTHNNGAPGGDGQTGDAGEGTGGTDRHNVVQIEDPLDNYPLPFERTTMWDGAKAIYCGHTQPLNPSKKQLAVLMASAGYYHCFEQAVCGAQSVETKPNKLNNLLNNAPASFEGCIMKFRPGTYHYICSRNNNFTNRSQKGKLVVKQAASR